MKTSIIDVPDMLSVLTVDELEKRFREVPGVKSATVNYAAKNATVRYDETLLEVADIKLLVHRHGQQSAGESKSGDDGISKYEHQSEGKPEHEHGEAATPDAASGFASQPKAAAPNAAKSSPAAPAVDAQGAKPPPGALPLSATHAPDPQTS